MVSSRDATQICSTADLAPVNAAPAQAGLTENTVLVINISSAKRGTFRMSTFFFRGIFIWKVVTVPF